MSNTSQGLIRFQVAYQVSPIILTGGLAENVPGGMIPIISLTQSRDYDLGLLSQSRDLPLDEFWATFAPVEGTTLIDNQVATYPFANQTTAANAIVTQPLHVSLQMIVPVKAQGNGYEDKLQTMTALRASLGQHIQKGGTFTVATPGFMFTNCLLVNLRDATPGDSRQSQLIWVWDFVQPLLTIEEARQAQNNLMSRISSGAQVTGDPPAWSGVQPTVGQPASGAAPSVVPAARTPAGASVSSPTSPAAPVTP